MFIQKYPKQFSWKEKCYLYANLCMYYYIHPCRLQFGNTKKCAFKKVFGLQEENLNQLLEFSYKFWIFFKSSITNTSRSTIKKSKTMKGNA